MQNVNKFYEGIIGKIDVKSLDCNDMLDLIIDHELYVNHIESKFIQITNFMEGGKITAISDQGITDAIKKWASKYNEVMEASNALDT